MRTFSLHKLRTRQFPYEHIFQDLLAREGLPSVEAQIGACYSERRKLGCDGHAEAFSPEMLEKNGLKRISCIAFVR